MVLHKLFELENVCIISSNNSLSKTSHKSTATGKTGFKIYFLARAHLLSWYSQD